MAPHPSLSIRRVTCHLCFLVTRRCERWNWKRARAIERSTGGRPGDSCLRTSDRERRNATCEKILSWHSASAENEINSVRGCSSTMSTGHTPRFKRIEWANHVNLWGGRERERDREGKKRKRAEERERRGTRRCVTETRREFLLTF